MAMAKFELKMLPGIDRPAIAALWPTLRGESIVLDLGASIGADAEHLVNLAVMGAAHERPERRDQVEPLLGVVLLHGTSHGVFKRAHPLREILAHP